MPARTRATNIPKRSPESTTEMADARRSTGAKSAASGRRIWGVTETTPTKYERASKAARLFVIARPIVNVVESATMQRISCLRRTKSPRGEIRMRPVAYLMTALVYQTRGLENDLTQPEREWVS